MQSGYNSWNILVELQRELKKEFLLVEKEQQEKIKLKRQIEQLVRSYHQLQIELHHSGAELLKEEGFENCYNFIKDVVTGISNNLELGRAIIYHADQQTTLCDLVIHGLYQNLETNDAFNKDITRLIYNLTCDLCDSGRTQRQRERIVSSWKLYMQKIEHCNYFEQIANPTIMELLKEDTHTDPHFGEQTVRLQQSRLNKKFKLQNNRKQKLISAFLDKVEAESLMCLPSIRIPLRGLLGTINLHKKNGLRKIWALISYFYLQPFIKILASNQVPQNVRENILQFVDELVVDWGFTGELALQSLELKQFSGEFMESKFPRTMKIAGKLVEINQERMKCFEANLSQSTSEIQIKINGGCLSLVQLRDLLILLNSHKETFSKINERVINRTVKIFEISHNLQVLNRDRPGLQFTSLAELKYEESISSDYYKNYTVVYRGETLKQMLKQVLVETQNIWQLRSEQRNSLAEIFQGLVTQNRQYHTGAAISAQLQMKIRYLIYLLGKRSVGGESKLLLDLKHDLKDRDIINIRLFEDTKFSLLKVYCNLRSLKNQLKQQKQAEKKRINKFTLIHKLESLKLDFCISSKASRNVGQGQEQENIDKYKYRLSLADQILILPISECVHKDNVFTGRSSHAYSVSKLITIFANLEEVKYLIAYPSFAVSKPSSSRYMYCNEGKIGQAFHHFLRIITQKIKTVQEDRSVIEHVMLRFLNEMILGTNNMPIVNASDRLLLQKIEMINQNRNQQLESPRKKLSRRRGSHHLMEGSMSEDYLWGSNESQLYEMGKRYLNSLTQANTSNEKIRKLREIVDIYRIALGKQEGETRKTSFLQDLIQKSIMVARPVNFISQLAFIEMFLAEEKMISGDGKVLKQFQKVASKIIKTEVASSSRKEIREL